MPDILVVEFEGERRLMSKFAYEQLRFPEIVTVIGEWDPEDA